MWPARNPHVAFAWADKAGVVYVGSGVYTGLTLYRVDGPANSGVATVGPGRAQALYTNGRAILRACVGLRILRGSVWLTRECRSPCQ